MGFLPGLKNIFRGPEGGTVVGNLLRTGVQMAKPALAAGANALAPGSGIIINALPLGQGLMKIKSSPKIQNEITDTIAQAQMMPAQSAPDAKTIAKGLKLSLIRNGIDALTADKLGAAAFEAAIAPPPMDATTSTIKDQAKTILNGALIGAKNGSLDAFLNNTPTGQQVVTDATNNQINKYLPFALGGVILLLMFKRK